MTVAQSGRSLADSQWSLNHLLMSRGSGEPALGRLRRRDGGKVSGRLSPDGSTSVLRGKNEVGRDFGELVVVPTVDIERIVCRCPADRIPCCSKTLNCGETYSMSLPASRHTPIYVLRQMCPPVSICHPRHPFRRSPWASDDVQLPVSCRPCALDAEGKWSLTARHAPHTLSTSKRIRLGECPSLSSFLVNSTSFALTSSGKHAQPIHIHRYASHRAE